ncbi:GGDEF domain-containing protein [Paenibacillus soyae]|uniref:Diguanylate cyclase n=1 Tax=Paenibacillus soyae TaxID=2969249 RepID=A0A9X2MLZ5_9BACL|nr:diguanylate cyclase [Paenibacillus soyae]MCR2803096.1 diguanylate cyclase [Paenibacillus soyae]
MKIFDTIQDLVANFAIVTAYLFLLNQVIFRNHTLDSPATTSMKVRMGLVAGLLGIVLMIFTVRMNGTLVDFRQLAIIIAAMYGGILPSVIAGTIIFLMRLLAFGAVTAPTIIAAGNTVLVAILVGVICMSRLSFWRKWIISLIICNLTTTIVFLLNIGRDSLLPILTYVTMMTAGGLFTAYLNEFLNKAKAQLKKIEREATIDYLTGLNNHRTFDEIYNSYLQTASDKDECLSIALVDIDFFKKVNDNYGHGNGDLVLKQLGEVLMKTTRSFDTVSRNGGEEFSVIMYDTPHKHALQIAERLRHAVSKNHFLLNNGRSIPLTVSIGVATYPDTNREELLDQADSALYQAKTSGRNVVCSNQAN